MHELAITQCIVDAACERADGKSVSRVLVRVGQLCAVIPDSMQFCFELVTEGTVAEGARLDIETETARARCRTCDSEFAIPDAILLCPCGSADVDVLSGRDLRILSMETR
ncbi:hydrogenase maturation nickel metallochaperone HypA [Rhodococcoides kyotonense]|uniref:Hydrogenase maturation factor HypA n=1 Tax=Rhodococcoides kyotonense TaxID=398843 RepID=A0A239JE10_9NOCA|nr:hydrogenase maturation nickel metallochaperone HypA [Rhodococcus kyotonensis]SNT04276.1 hydrogenase nickel incorporation protein HypA/HybF [Rhodococcus kyotonensis]